MATPIFRFARNGDKVWDVRYGWGTILNMKTAPPHGTYQLVAKFLTRTCNVERTFTIEGIDLECENQTLFEKQMILVEEQ